MEHVDFVNEVFDLCIKHLASEGFHYEVEENGHKTWVDELHNAIQDACVKIITAFDDYNEDHDLCKCEWCGELCDKFDMIKELNMGYLCSSCVDALHSRGEKLTIVEE